MTTSLIRFCLIALLFALSACTTGWHHNYQQSVPVIPYEGTEKVILYLTDARKMPPENVGKVDALYGEPWFVRTASGEPFIEELGVSICQGFTERGYICTIERQQNPDPKQDVLRIIQEQYPDRIVHLILNDWYNRIYSGAEVDYDLGVEVLNQRGRLISSVTFKGTEVLDTETYVNPAENASIVAPEFLGRLLTKVFTHPDVQRSFQNIEIVQPRTQDYIRGDVGKTHVIRQKITDDRRKGYRR